VDFEQAVIKIEKESEFAELKSAIERTFAVGSVGKFLKKMESRGIRIRNFDGVLDNQVIEYVDGGLKQGGKTAKGLYGALALSDRGQMREFYLSKIEQVDAPLRHKFHKIYQYY
jgi:hypothetical protein